MTWEEVDKNARCAGSGIIKLLGNAGSSCPVMILMEKCPECLTLFFGVLESGNYYVPIDIEMPLQRIEKIIDTIEKTKARLKANVSFDLTMELLLLAIKEN